MKSLPSKPSSATAARKPSLSPVSFQATSRAGSRDGGAVSRVSSRSQVPVTANQTTTVTRSTLHSSHTPTAATAPSIAPSSAVATVDTRSSTAASAAAAPSPASHSAASTSSSAATSSASGSSSSTSPAATRADGAYAMAPGRSASRASASSLSSSSILSAGVTRAPRVSGASSKPLLAAAVSSSSSTAATSLPRAAASPPVRSSPTPSPLRETGSPGGGGGGGGGGEAAAAAAGAPDTTLPGPTGASPSTSSSSFVAVTTTPPSPSIYHSPPPSPFPTGHAPASSSTSDTASVSPRSSVSAAASAPPQISPASFSSVGGSSATGLTSGGASAAFASDSGSQAFILPSSVSPPSSSASFSSSSTPASSAASVADSHADATSSVSASHSSLSCDPSPRSVTLRPPSTQNFSEDHPPQIASLEHLPSAIREARAHSEKKNVSVSNDPCYSKQHKTREGSHDRAVISRRGLQHQLTAGPGAVLSSHSDDGKQHELADVEVLKFMAKARLAASLEKWNDVVAAMKQVAATQPALNASQRMLVEKTNGQMSIHLFFLKEVGAYTHQLNERRSSTKQLYARLSALEVLQQRPQTREGTGEVNVTVSQASEGLGGAGEAAELAARLAVPGGRDSGSLSLSDEGLEEDERCAKKKTPEEQLAGEQAKACALLGEALLGSEVLVQNASFFEYITLHYCQRVAESMLGVLNDMETFVTSVLLPAAESLMASAGYQQLRGDSLRRVAQEFRDLKKYSQRLEPVVVQRNDQVRQILEKRSRSAYEAALRLVEEAIPTKVSSVRLGIINNYAVLLQEMVEGKGSAAAVDMLGYEFRQTVRQMYEVKDEEEYQRIISVLGLIRDNVETWSRLEGVNRVPAEVLGLGDT